jgi:three-Cys-motif partner protein
MKKYSQANLLDHSEAKIKLLEKYLQKYLSVITNDNYTKKIYLFDLLCGEGIYENKKEGSPLVILKNVNEIYKINKIKGKQICNIDIILNDADKDKITKLKLIIKQNNYHFPETGKIFFYNKEYLDILLKVTEFINSLNHEKAFVFIDPYGYKDIRASQIKDLLSSRKTEVLLFLPTQFMYRFDEKGTPQVLIDIIKELIDIKDWKSNTSVFCFIEQFTNALRKYLGDGYFVDTFTIEKDSKTVYCLFFFSTHIRGFEKMLQTKWELDDEDGRGFSYEKTGDLFSKSKYKDFEDRLVNFLSEERNNLDIYSFTLKNGFLTKHVNQILKNLEENNRIEIVNFQIEKRKKGAFYINYDEYRDNKAKIKIKVK